MTDDIKLEDGSGDKKYFTMIPNYIANHSSAIDQALYFQMKRYAGENGKCFASQETLMKKMDIGRKSYTKSLNYLLEKGWIKFVGMTKGKTRPVKTYAIVDIWKLNVLEYEKIPSERAVSPVKEKDTDQKSNMIQAKRTIEEEPIKEDPGESAPIVAAPLKVDSFFGKAKKETDALPMNVQQFILMCRHSMFRNIRLIGEYADAREDELDFHTRGQWREFGNRNMRIAKELAPFTDRQFQRALDDLFDDLKTDDNKQGFITTWGMETLKKYLIK